MLKTKRRKTPWEETLGETSRRDAMNNALLRAEFAARLFVLEKGHVATSLEELVPEYLAEMPIDAYSERPLRWKVEADRLMIYSVGRDGIDDGERFSDWQTYWGSTTGYDYDLETWTRK